MAAPKGFRPPNAGIGRPKGVPNKSNAMLKDMILGALDKAGGIDYLYDQAIANPGPFMTLVGKVLPLQIVGEGGGPVIVVTGVHRENDIKTIEHEPIEQHAEGN